MNTESPKSNVQSRQTASGPPRSPKSLHGFRGDGKDAFHRVPRNISSNGTQWNASLPTFDLSGALGTACPTFGFTLIEIAICLAVIGFALVAIIGILPMGMQVQKDNRQETIINQDSSMWMDFIRNGSKHADDLTNYVYAITNYYSVYGARGKITSFGAVGFTYTNSGITPEFPVTVPITNGNIILGLLSTPKYVTISTPNAPPSYRSNFVVAWVRSMSGAASDKFPQKNADIQASAFAYRMAVDLVPYSDFDRNWTNYLDPALYTPTTNATEIAKRFNYFVLATNYQNNLYDLRFTFRWPLDIRGTPGAGKQSYRTLASGQLIPTNEPPGIANLITTYSMLSRTYGPAKE